jgi:hypothetical protein
LEVWKTDRYRSIVSFIVPVIHGSNWPVRAEAVARVTRGSR